MKQIRWFDRRFDFDFIASAPAAAHATNGFLSFCCRTRRPSYGPDNRDCSEPGKISR